MEENKRKIAGLDEKRSSGASREEVIASWRVLEQAERALLSTQRSWGAAKNKGRKEGWKMEEKK